MDKEAELRYQLALHKLGPDRYSIYEAEILEGYAELLHERERGNDAEAVRKLAAAIRGVPPDLALQLRQEAHRIELGLE